MVSLRSRIFVSLAVAAVVRASYLSFVGDAGSAVGSPRAIGSNLFFCADALNENAERVACNQLGFSDFDQVQTTTSTQQQAIVDVSCYGAERSILNCTTTTGTCDEDSRLELSCLDFSTFRARLDSDSGGSTGVLELYSNGYTGTVCASSFTNLEAQTACQMIGYTRAVSFQAQESSASLRSNGRSDSPWITNLECLEDTTDLNDCNFDHTASCDPRLDVLLSCAGDEAVETFTQVRWDVYIDSVDTNNDDNGFAQSVVSGARDALEDADLLAPVIRLAFKSDFSDGAAIITVKINLEESSAEDVEEFGYDEDGTIARFVRDALRNNGFESFGDITIDVEQDQSKSNKIAWIVSGVVGGVLGCCCLGFCAFYLACNVCPKRKVGTAVPAVAVEMPMVNPIDREIDRLLQVPSEALRMNEAVAWLESLAGKRTVAPAQGLRLVQGFTMPHSTRSVLVALAPALTAPEDIDLILEEVFADEFKRKIVRDALKGQ
eukprot:c7783_g1_i1.p1 GENE.c7783_g1_i1~~c7783_g1_i1.p1  ORF type:complete len:492 (+),score=112.67 c7783_g1_i1:36-1511(+)